MLLGMTEPSVGDLVAIEFWDHCEGEGGDYGAVRCIVYGECRAAGDWGFGVCGWSRGDEDDGENETAWSIVRGAVIDIRVLEVV